MHVRGFMRVTTLRWMVAALLAVGAAVWVWDAFVKYQWSPKNFGVIVSGEIYRSGELLPGTTRMVAEAREIRTIVDLGAHEPGSIEEGVAQRTADALGIDRIVFDLQGDATGDPNAYLRTLRIMTDPERQPVLVHCAAGSERTGAAVALYRQIVEGVALDDAYEETKAHKHRSRRNPRLRAVLERWSDPIREAFENGLDRVPGTEPETASSTDPHPPAGEGG
ncbi:MAG: tyrosine-protein phosphatase [Planctomycetota bacterium]